MRRLAGVVAAVTAASMMAGCADLMKFVTPENLAKAQDILKQAGVAIQFKDPKTGQTVDIKSKDDVKTIKTKDGRELKEGTDYKFQDGKLIFNNLQQKQTIAITRPDGTTFNIDVEPDRQDQKARLIPNAQGQFDEIDDNVDFEQAFKEQQERDKAHRVTVEFGDKIDLEEPEIVAFGFKHPDGPGMLLPTFAWADEDGKIAFDVQALGGPDNEDVTKRLWILVTKIGERQFKVYRFKITKQLQRPTGQPGAQQTLPPAQTVTTAEFTVADSAEYESEDKVREGEKLQDPGAPPPPPEHQM